MPSRADRRSLNSHRHLVSETGRAAKIWALSLDYRLAPEHAFPAAVEDAVSGYRFLLSRGYQPGRIALAGDSAGGGPGYATHTLPLYAFLPAAVLTYRR